MTEKDVRFTEKKVDESWKEQIDRDKETVSRKPSSSPGSDAVNRKTAAAPAVTSKPFVNLINSLAMQALMHLGELKDEPGMETGGTVDLRGAKELIDLLIAVQKKTEGNLSPEEKGFFEQVIPQLQLKFSEHA